MIRPISAGFVCGCEVICCFSAGESYLATRGSREVVLKRIDEDCLVDSGASLHPSIRDRLQRVREVALTQVATLYGVERDEDGTAYLVWEFVKGRRLTDWPDDSGVTTEMLLQCVREVITAIEGMHVRGLVHGAVRGNNVIVSADGQPKLTHVSPLLYVDPQADVIALAEMLHHIAEARPDAAPALRQLAEQAIVPSATLKQLGSVASKYLQDPGVPVAAEGRPEPASNARPAQTLGLLVLAVVTILLGIGLRMWVAKVAPPISKPPDAPSSALQP